MKATKILKAMVQDGALFEVGVLLLPVLVAAATMLSYLVG